MTIMKCRVCGKKLGARDEYTMEFWSSWPGVKPPPCKACWKKIMNRKMVADKTYQAAQEAADAAWKLKSSCQHVWHRSGEDIECFVCGEDGGWWCPESKDGRCVYPDDGCGEECVKCGRPYARN